MSKSSRFQDLTPNAPLITTITDASVIDKILRHLGLPTEASLPMPAKVAGWLPGVEPSADWVTE